MGYTVYTVYCSFWIFLVAVGCSRYSELFIIAALWVTSNMMGNHYQTVRRGSNQTNPGARRS